MPEITYITRDNKSIVVDAMESMTLMEAAIIADVPGIIGMCGGLCICATCHVIVDEKWSPLISPPSDEEREMIESLDHGEERSRIGCQVTITPDMSGMIVRVAEEE